MQAPKPVARAPFHRWLFERGLSVADGARALSISQQTLERNMLDPINPRFYPASIETRIAARKYTCGDIRLDDWFEKPIFDDETVQ